MKNVRKEQIETINGIMFATEMELQIGGKGDYHPYFSISDGTNAAGVYLSDDARKQLIKFLQGEKSGSRRKSA